MTLEEAQTLVPGQEVWVDNSAGVFGVFRDEVASSRYFHRPTHAKPWITLGSKHAGLRILHDWLYFTQEEAERAAMVRVMRRL